MERTSMIDSSSDPESSSYANYESERQDFNRELFNAVKLRISDEDENRSPPGYGRQEKEAVDFFEKVAFSNEQTQANRPSSPDVVIIPAPPPPAPPPPPNLSQDEQSNMNVKRINWEKLDVDDMESTVWGQIGQHDYISDVVRYLELEQQFSTKQSKLSPAAPDQKDFSILSPKKAYNISILLGHLKMSADELRDCLYRVDEKVLKPELLKQLLKYAPDSTEALNYRSYQGKLDDLNNADRFSYKMSEIIGYEERLKALLFMSSFDEKIEELKRNLHSIRNASRELKQSKKLAKILELVLAMGNYMNQGNTRVGGANAFKVQFLAQLDKTKTGDNQSTFLHVLLEAIGRNFPELLMLADELPSVPEAAKVPDATLNHEIHELKTMLQEIQATVDRLSAHKSDNVDDRFTDVVSRFISQASDEAQKLFHLHQQAMSEFQSMARFFGENPANSSTADIFSIFDDFLQKFQRAHQQNQIPKRT